VPAETEFEVVDYSPRYGDAFARLNREWLERYFRVEPIDAEILGDPQSKVIEPGGAILYLLLDSEVIGTVALKHEGEGAYELTKMAVTSGHQNKGLGRVLLCAVLQRFTELDGNRLYLESHSSLMPALALYESAGFRHQPRPTPSEYERADVYMVYQSK